MAMVSLICTDKVYSSDTLLGDDSVINIGYFLVMVQLQAACRRIGYSAA
jgi:hypothetical protein